MRIQVIGNSAAAKTLRGYLCTLAYIAVVDSQPDYSIFIEETDGQEIILDSIECPFQRACFRFMRELVDYPVRIQTAGGIQSDRAVRIYVPKRDADQKAVSTGVFRGISTLFGPRPTSPEAPTPGGQSRGPEVVPQARRNKRRWWEYFLGGLK